MDYQRCPAGIFRSLEFRVEVWLEMPKWKLVAYSDIESWVHVGGECRLRIRNVRRLCSGALQHSEVRYTRMKLSGTLRRGGQWAQRRTKRKSHPTNQVKYVVQEGRNEQQIALVDQTRRTWPLSLTIWRLLTLMRTVSVQWSGHSLSRVGSREHERRGSGDHKVLKTQGILL